MHMSCCNKLTGHMFRDSDRKGLCWRLWSVVWGLSLSPLPTRSSEDEIARDQAGDTGEFDLQIGSQIGVDIGVDRTVLKSNLTGR